MTEDRELLERVIVAFIGATCELAIDPARADASAPLFESGQLALAGHALDSLAIAEVLVALEQELGIEILGRAEGNHLRSIAALSEFLAASAGPEKLAAFERRWRSPEQTRTAAIQG